MELISQSKTSRIEEGLLRIIREDRLKVGDRILSEEQLLRKFDVSRITVIRGIKNLVSKGVLRRRQGQGTFVKSIDFIEEMEKFQKNLHAPRPLKIAYLHFYSLEEERHNLENDASHFSTFTGAKEVSEQYNCSIEMKNLEEVRDIEGTKAMIAENAWDGIILVASTNETVRAVAESNVPAVMYGGIYGERNINYVLPDNEDGACLMTNYLLSLGHARTAFVTIHGDSNFRYRQQGYNHAFKQHGLVLDPELLFTYNGPDSINDLILAKKPSAIFAANDSIAVEVAMSLYKLGIKIPDDISLVGFNDDSRYTSMFPELTTMAVPQYDLGRMAVKLLSEQARGDSFRNIKVFLPTKLISRSSVKDFTGDKRS